MKEISNIKIIGDSLASGMGISGSHITSEIITNCDGYTFYRRAGGCGWATQLSRLLKNCTITNNGCDGITSSQAWRCWNDIYSDTDELVLLLLGANDRKEIDGMTHLEKNLTRMISSCKENNSKVILITPHPVTLANDLLSSRLYHMADVVNTIRRVGHMTGTEIIDVYKCILDSGVDINAIMHGGDGNHPTDAMANMEGKIIESFFLNVAQV